MHDVGYVVAGYAVTMATLAVYRWRLAIRTRKARRYVATVSGRPSASASASASAGRRAS